MPHITTLLASDRANTVLHRATSVACTAYAHTPFGQHSPAANEAPRPGFNGQHLEHDGSYLLGNGYRAYNPRVGRFNTPDTRSPFGTGGLNTYMYCSGDPVNRQDPSGHEWQDIANSLGIAGGIALILFGARKPIGKLLKRSAGGPVNKRMVGFGATAVAFGAVGLAAEDDDFQTGMFIAASVALFSAVVIGNMRTGKKAETVMKRSNSAVARKIDSINPSLGARASAKPGTITTQTTTTTTTFSKITLSPSETVAADAAAEIAKQTAAINVAVSRRAHMSDMPGNSTYLHNVLHRLNRDIRI